MSYSITGSLYSGSATQQKTDKFAVRQFVLEVNEEANGSTFTNHIQFQLVNNNCALLDQFQKGQKVTVHFNVRGSLWQANDGQQKCITNLNAWKIEAAQQQQPASTWGQQPSPTAQPHIPSPQSWGQSAPQTMPSQQIATWGHPQQYQQPNEKLPF